MDVAEPLGSASAFVGRDRELRELLDGLEESAAGRGRLFLLGGEPGIGKSRLADELGRHARERGHRVLWGRAWEDAGAPPYWPWVQVIRTHLRSVDPGTVRQQLGFGAADVAQMLPELRAQFPDLPPPADSESDSARFQLFDSTATFLRNASAATPLVVVLDDLHASDTPSLLFLRFLARQLSEMRLMLVATYRDVEVTAEHPLAEAIGQLTREPITRVLVIDGLRPRAVAQLVEASAGVSAAPHLVAALSSETGGNPLFLREALRLLASEGRLHDVATGTSLRLAVPAGIREVLTRRVDSLGAPSVEMLAHAATIGPEFSVEVLRRLSGHPDEPDRLLELLDRAEREGLVAPLTGASGRYRFSHDLVRETLYDGMPRGRRVRLHRQIAETIEELYAASREAHLAELAHHYFEAAQGGEPDRRQDGSHRVAAERAKSYASRAGEQAARSLAFEEAVRLYRMALSVLDLAPASDEQERAEILLALGDAEGRSGDLPSARVTFLEAAQISRRTGRAAQLGRAALGYGGRFVWPRAGDDPHLIGLLRDALAFLGGEDEHLRVRLMTRLACAWRDSPGHFEQSDALTREAVRVARSLDDPPTLSYALIGRYGAIYWPHNAEERLAIAREMLAVAEAAADAERIIDAHYTLAFAYSDLGRTADVRSEIEMLSRLAEQLRQPAQQWVARAFGVSFALMQGDYAEADRLMALETAPGYPTTPIRDDVSAARMHRFLRARELGGLEDVEPLVRASVQEFPWYPVHAASLTCLLIDLGRRDEARTEFEGLAAGGFAAFYRDNEWLLGMSLASDACASLDDQARAEILHAELMPFSGSHAVGHTEGSVGAVDRYLGLLAATMGELEAGVQHLTDAVAANERMAAWPWAAHSRYDLARVLLRRDAAGDRGRAAQLLSEALDTARRLGMSQLEARLTAERGEAPPDEGRRAGVRAIFRREGEYWTVAFDDETARIRDSKGIRYLAALLSRPGDEVHALDLVRITSPAERPAVTDPEAIAEAAGDWLGGAGPPLDAPARAAYRERIAELREERAEAERMNDPERRARAEAELEFVTAELSGAVGIGGRDRTAVAAAERARISVTRAIRSAMPRVAEQAPDLGAHLEATIRTGTYCSYTPDPRVPITWTL